MWAIRRPVFGWGRRGAKAGDVESFAEGDEAGEDGGRMSAFIAAEDQSRVEAQRGGEHAPNTPLWSNYA